MPFREKNTGMGSERKTNHVKITTGKKREMFLKIAINVTMKRFKWVD